MKPLLHLIRKDVRYAGKWLALTWLLWALVALYPFLTRIIPMADQPRMIIPLLSAAWVIALLTQTRIIHLDPVIGNTRFLATRPCLRSSEITAKLVLIFFGIVVPIVSFKILKVAFYFLDLSIKDYLLLVVSELVFVSTICSVTLLPAVFSRKLGATVPILAIAVIAFWLFWLVTQWQGIYEAFGIFIDDQIDLNTSRRFLFQLTLIVFSCWTVVGFALTRSWVQPALAFLFLIPASVSAYFWNVNFVRSLSDHRHQARQRVILESLPLRVGASAVTRRARYTVRAILPRGDHVDVVLSIEAFWLTLSGNMPGTFTGDVIFQVSDEKGTTLPDFNRLVGFRSVIGNVALEQQRHVIQHPGDEIVGARLLIVGTEGGEK